MSVLSTGAFFKASAPAVSFTDRAFHSAVGIGDTSVPLPQLTVVILTHTMFIAPIGPARTLQCRPTVSSEEQLKHKFILRLNLISTHQQICSKAWGLTF